MYGYIYLTENLANGRCYIGKHKASDFDVDYKGSGIVLKSAINKYGWDNFVTTIIEPCESECELNNKERYWILKCNAVDSDLFYNIADGGQGGDLHKFINYKKLSESLKGKQKSDIAKKHMSENHADVTGSKHPKAKKVRCVETGAVFGCIKDAAKYAGLKTTTHIGSCLKGYRETSGGYHWELWYD